MSQPLVSIVIPCYNGENFIRDTINSVLNQTHQNIEIIVVNDGSTDNSIDVIREFKEVTLIDVENGGVSKARNIGYAQSKGEYVCFLDADDWLYPETIGQKVSALNESNADLAFGEAVLTDEHLNETGATMSGAKEDHLNALLKYAPPAIPCPSNVLLSRKIIELVGLFDENLSTSADYDMWIRVARKGEVKRIESPGVKYRQHGSNMFSNLDLLIHDMEYIFEKYKGELPVEKTRKIFNNSMIKHAAKKGDFKMVIQFVIKSLLGA